MLSLLNPVPFSEEEQAALFARVKEKLLANCEPTRIIVFGSMASRDIREGSDLDVCLLFKTDEEAQQAQSAILGLPPLLGIATDYLFFSETYFNQRKDFGGVCVEIAAKGITIYES